MTEGASWIFIFCAVMSFQRGVSFLRGVSFHRRGVRKLFLLSPEKVKTQRVGGGVSAELRGRGGGSREGGKKRRAILFLLSPEKVNLASAVLANGSLPEEARRVLSLGGRAPRLE